MVMISRNFNAQLLISWAGFVLISTALATPVSSGQSRSLSTRVLPRQNSAPVVNLTDTSNSAPECKDRCSSIFNTLTACKGNPQCGCTDANSDAYAGCLNCIVTSHPDYTSQGQKLMDDLAESCKNPNVTFKPQTIRATNGTGTNTTAQGSTTEGKTTDGKNDATRALAGLGAGAAALMVASAALFV
ncbi:hypothetical protein PM082_012331 [Marasmius tenuissimus]|nr:hypothetical protein PM082_012331 [Marasmius tenuissimus]